VPSGMSYSKADVQGCTQHGKPKSHLSIPLPKKIPRNFAATQVAGVSLSLYNKYASRDEPVAAFRESQAAGHVQCLE